jgi:hypothetical protein
MRIVLRSLVGIGLLNILNIFKIQRRFPTISVTKILYAFSEKKFPFCSDESVGDEWDFINPAFGEVDLSICQKNQFDYWGNKLGIN